MKSTCLQLLFVASLTIYILEFDCKVITLENFTDIKGNDAIKEIRIMYTGNQSLPIGLTRGVPLFAEVDFVPRYFPSNMNAISLTVMIPETIRRSRLGGPWIIGWNQERIPQPICHICTNTEQSYTIPVTIYLPDDGWCAEGTIPTGWRIEAVRTNSETNSAYGYQASMGNDAYSNSDQIIALIYDSMGQIMVRNKPNSGNCIGIQETIRYEVSSSGMRNQTNATPIEENFIPTK